MKKIVLKATALAIGALVGGSAFAAVTAPVDLADATTAFKAAKELKYTTDALSLTPAGGAAGALNFTTTLGFGVAANTTRYIRIDFNGATLDGNLGTTIGTNIDVGTLTAGQSSVAISAGGQAGDSYVIFAVAVGGTDVAQSSSAAVKIAVPGLRIASNAADVTVSYTLHETGTSAVTGVGGSAVLKSTTNKTLVTFASGLNFAVSETGTATASVEDAFKKFLAGGQSVAVNLGAGAVQNGFKVGTLTYGAVANVKGRDGADVTLAALVAAGTKLVATGDFSVPFGADAAAQLTSVFIAAGTDCTTKAGSTAATALTSGTASFTIDEAAIAGRSLCYWTNGTGAIAASTYKARVDVTSDDDATSSNIGDKDLSSIARDGTELTAPFATIHPDYVSRVFLTSTHSADAVVTAQGYYDDGTTCTGTPVALANLKAGKQMEYKIADVCPTLGTSTGSNTTRMAVKFTIAAPKSKIEGVYNQYKKGDATFANGKTTDQNSYSLHRPVAN